MKLTRRNTVIGIGTLAAGAGVIGGTGAFDQVQAQRDFSVSVADDDEAILTLDDHDDSSITGTETASGANNQEILTISMSEKLNDEAITTFLAAFTVGNNGNEDVTSLDITFLSPPNQGNQGNQGSSEVTSPGVVFKADDTQANSQTNYSLPSYLSDGDNLDGITIKSGDTVNVKIEVDTRANHGNYDENAIGSVEFNAQTSDASS